jgi:hypothetical protein
LFIPALPAAGLACLTHSESEVGARRVDQTVGSQNQPASESRSSRHFGEGQGMKLLDYSQVVEKMERETGIEPATSSLGIFKSIEYKGQRRSPGCMQIQANQQLLSQAALIGG